MTAEAPRCTTFSMMTLDYWVGSSSRSDDKPSLPMLILTDHNKRTIEHSLLNDAAVIAIVDHHADSGDHAEVVGMNATLSAALAVRVPLLLRCFWMRTSGETARCLRT